MYIQNVWCKMVNRCLSPEFSGNMVVFLYQHTNELINRVLTYSIELKYSNYTSTQREAWRASVNGINDVIKDYVELCNVTPEITCNEPAGGDILSAFGIAEAHKHKKRGIEPAVFLGLYKYYVFAYLDTLEDFGKNEEEREMSRELITKIFNKIEHAFVAEWMSMSGNTASAEFIVEE